MGLPFDDLVQEGALGLIDALDRYDRTRGVAFEAYARFRVRRAIRNALTDQARLVRLPKHVVERRRALDRIEADLTAASGRAPTPVELAAATGLSVRAVTETRMAATSPMSLDARAGAEGSTLASLLLDASAADPERGVVERERVRRLRAAVAALPVRQREVITQVFGLDRPPRDITDVAADLRLSRQRARTIRRDALHRLKTTLDAAELEA